MKRATQLLVLIAIGSAGALCFPRTSTAAGTPLVVQDATPPPTPAVEKPQDGTQKQKAPDKLPPGKVCIDCHTDVSGEKHVHRPVRWGNCKLCHIQSDVRMHSFTPPKDMGAVCNECHLLPTRTSLHAPVRDGQCLSCHLAHQSNERYLLKSRQDPELCGPCHADEVGVDMRFVHGPIAAGTCSLCHMPHSSNQLSLLRPAEETGCLMCHVEMEARLQPPNSVHPPVQEDCAQCHDPHASNHRYQLKNDQTTLCMDCHRPMIEKLQSQPVYHEALKSEEGCAYCHDVHSSPYPKMLKRPVKELCMDCHTAALKRPDGTSLPGMGDLLTKSAHLHGPVNEGNCAACHDPHGSVTFSLLRDPYPKEFYAPWKAERYGLCFRCHDVAAFSRPSANVLTKFRNGDVNLHYLHVTDEKKGRTCRACHDTHASDRPKHITEGVPFGTWEIPINFAITSTGGSCSPGCHVKKEYDRVTPVELTWKPPVIQPPQPSEQQ